MKKILGALLGITLLFSACAGGEETKQQLEEESVETVVESVQEEAESSQEVVEVALEETESIQESEESEELVAEEEISSDTYAQAYMKQIQICEELNDSNAEWTYDLIYLNEDDIPELVAGVTGYYVYVYTWEDGELYTLMDGWGYGAGGNVGYEYIPYKNVVRNYNNDMAGAIRYVTYVKMNENHEMESYYEKSLKHQIFKEGEIDKLYEEDFEVEELYFYYGDEEITEEEYDSYMIDGEYSHIYGTFTAEEMIGQLQ